MYLVAFYFKNNVKRFGFSHHLSRLNPVLFQYSLAVAVQHREDTKDVNIPSIVSLFPDQFVDPAVFPKLREEGAAVQQENRVCIGGGLLCVRAFGESLLIFD